MYLAWVYKKTSKTPLPSFDVWYLRTPGHNLFLFMLITMVLSLLNRKLYKYVCTDSPAFPITYIITPCSENQAAKLVFERLSLNGLGKKKGASTLSPDVLRPQLFKVWWWSHVTWSVLSLWMPPGQGPAGRPLTMCQQQPRFWLSIPNVYSWVLLGIIDPNTFKKLCTWA